MAYPPIDSINFPNPTTSQISQTQSLTGWWFQPIWKISINLSNWIISQIFGVKNQKKYLKPPPTSTFKGVPIKP